MVLGVARSKGVGVRRMFVSLESGLGAGIGLGVCWEGEGRNVLVF